MSTQPTVVFHTTWTLALISTTSSAVGIIPSSQVVILFQFPHSSVEWIVGVNAKTPCIPIKKENNKNKIFFIKQEF